MISRHVAYGILIIIFVLSVGIISGRSSRLIRNHDDTAADGTLSSSEYQSMHAPPSFPKERKSVSDCAQVGAPPKHHYQQIMTLVGAVPTHLLRDALEDLRKVTGVTFWALDGTLLNLLRWGRIVNDNDVDVGFVLNDPAIGSHNTTAQYYGLYKLLQAQPWMDPASERDYKNLYHTYKMAKHGKCKLRGGSGPFMQCRHKNGVMIDLFAPGFTVGELTNYSFEDLLPTKDCRSFDSTFPCPRRGSKLLKTWTLNFAVGKNAAPVRSLEYKECVAFSRRKEEQTKERVKEIIDGMRSLDQCGYLSMSDAISDENCQQILRNVGL